MNPTMKIHRDVPGVLTRVGILLGLLSGMGCTSLEGIIYQEKSLEHAECRDFAKDKYAELMTAMGQACFLHHQMDAMTAIDNDEGMPSLERRIDRACVQEEHTTLEMILANDYGARLDGDMPGIAANSEECRTRQSGHRAQ